MSMHTSYVFADPSAPYKDAYKQSESEEPEEPEEKSYDDQSHSEPEEPEEPQEDSYAAKMFMQCCERGGSFEDHVSLFATKMTGQRMSCVVDNKDGTKTISTDGKTEGTYYFGK